MASLSGFEGGVSLLTVALLALLCWSLGAGARAEERDASPFDKQLPRGIVAVALGPAAEKPPTLSTALTDWEPAVSLDTFYRALGSPTPVTPAEARLLWDETALYVYVECDNPPGHRANERHDDLHLFINTAYPAPDRVAHLTVGLSSRKSGRWLEQGGEAGAIVGFKTQVVRRPGAWRVQFTVPWELVGGKPAGPFGLMIRRYHQLYGETSSPAAIDRVGDPHPLLYMEATLGGRKGVRTAAATLCTLPSGLRRWQPTARLTWPTPAERRLLWAEQQRLTTPTTPETLGKRLYLAQRLYDVLRYEGVPKEDLYSGIPATEAPEYSPGDAVALVNAALLANDVPAACQVVDAFLGQLDRTTRRWFADGSPGNVQTEAWAALERIETVSREGETLRLEGRAGRRPVTLYLSLPAFGGVRLHTEATGFFPVEELAPVTTDSLTGETLRVSGPDSEVILRRGTDWSISISAKSGGPSWRLERGDLGFRFSPEGEVRAVDLQWELGKEEAIYGFGEYFNALNQRGNVLTLWDCDAWEGNYDSCLLNLAYKPIPLLHSTGGYSVFAATSYRVRADVGNADPARCRLTAAGPVCDLFVWVASPQQALQSYTALTGRPLLPPRWVFQPWMGGGGGRWASGPLKNATSEIVGVARRFAELDIPHSAVYAEGEASADPRLYEELAPYGLKILTWGRSQGRGRRTEGTDESALPYVRRADGSVYRYPRGHALAGHFPYLDFTHPGVMEMLRTLWQRHLDLGVAGSMVDFGDLVPEDAVFYNGLTGAAMHNRYAYDYHRSFHELYRERRGDDWVLFSRSASPGSQAWLCQFAGDHQSNFFGMSAALRGGLNLAASGFPFWGCDIGGYASHPNEEQYLRWVEWGAFSPIMRAHGVNPREPWEFSEEAVRIYRHYAWVRESLLDYLYGAAVAAHQTGVPMMRPLPLAFPGVAALATCDDQYMLGEELMVAPVHGPGETRRVLLPPGRWTSLWEGLALAGGRAVTVTAPLDLIPVYLREGAIVPVRLSPSLQLGHSLSQGATAALIVTPPNERRTVVYGGVEGGTREYTVAPLPKGMSLELDGAKTQYLLLYGRTSAVRSVTVERGEAARWSWEEDSRRTVVELPPAAGKKVRVEIGW